MTIYISIFLFVSLLFNKEGFATTILQCSSSGECENLPDCSTATYNNIHSSKIYCNVYYLCMNRTMYQFSCSSGLFFNEIRVTCDYNFNVNCKNKTVLEDTTTTKFSVTDEDSLKSTMKNKEDTSKTLVTTEINKWETTKPQIETIIINTRNENDTNTLYTSTLFTGNENTSEETNMTFKTTLYDNGTTIKPKEEKISIDIASLYTNSTGFTNPQESSLYRTAEETNMISRNITKTTELPRQYNITDSITSQEHTIDLTNEILYNFECVSRFGLFPDPESCNYFYQCSHFKAYRLQCPSDLHFNPVLQVCDWPPVAGCENTTFLKSTIPSTTLDLSENNHTSTRQDFSTTDNLSKYTFQTSISFTPKEKYISTGSILETSKDTMVPTTSYDTTTTSESFNLTTQEEISTNSQSPTMETTNNRDFISNTTSENTFLSIETTKTYNITEIPQTPSIVNEFITISTIDQDMLTEESPITENKQETTEGSTIELISTIKEKETTKMNYTFFSTANPNRTTTSNKFTTIPTVDQDMTEESPITEVKQQTIEGSTIELISTTTQNELTTISAEQDMSTEESRNTEHKQETTEGPTMRLISTTKEEETTNVSSTSDQNRTTGTNKKLIFTTLSLIDDNTETETSDWKSTTDESVSTKILPETESFETFICLSKFGLFPDPETCNYFYQCSHNQSYRLRCPSNLHFNPVLQVCDWPQAAGCENVSSYTESSKPVTTIAPIYNYTTANISIDDSSTQQFTTDIDKNTTQVYNTEEVSSQSTKIKFTSTPGKDILTNEITAEDKPEVTKISLNQTDSTMDFISTVEEKFITEDNKTLSSTTNNDKMLETLDELLLTANISTVDNTVSEIQMTNWKSTTDVSISTVIPPGTDVSFENFTCPSRFGHFPDPESCNYFYQCSNFNVNHLRCPSNLHFNPELKVCDWPNKSGCIL